MTNGFITNVASDLISGMISYTIEVLGGPAIEKIRERIYWHRLMSRVVSRLCYGFEEFEKAEGERLLAINELFFRDPLVRSAFTEQLLVGDVDQELLRNRFIATYGEDQIELFDRNLDEAISMFYKELEESLDPAEKVVLANLTTKIKESTETLEDSIKLSTETLLVEEAGTKQLVIDSRDRIIEEIRGLQSVPTIDVELSSEYQAQIDHARDLLGEYHPIQARDYLLSLKDRIWEKAMPDDRFRLLTHLGYANLLLNNELEAAQLFIDALDLKPNNGKALSNAALGFLLQGENDRCLELARQSLKVDPTCVSAYASIIHASNPDESFESIVVNVPVAYRETFEVAMALGQVAQKRGDYSEAEKWLSVSIHADTKGRPDPRGALADLQLDRILRNDFPLQLRGLINPFVKELTEIVDLYNFAWERVSGTEIHSTKISWLVNRATAKALLNDIDGAIEDIDEALKVTPSNTYLKRHRALLSYKSGDVKKAASLFREILVERETLDAKLWLSVILYEDQKPKEAKELIEELIEEKKLDPILKRDATGLLILCHIQTEDYLIASDLSRSLRLEFPNDPGVLALCARVAKSEGRNEEATAFLDEAQEKITSGTSRVNRYRVIDELYRNHNFNAAAKLLEDIADIEVDSEPTRQLLSSYYHSGNFSPALEICETLRKKYGALRFITELESAIYEEIGNLPAAERVCQEFLATYPDNLLIKLRLAVVYYRLKEYKALDAFLNQNIDTSELSFEASNQLAKLFLARGRYKRAISISYEARRQFFDNPSSHLSYIQIFLRCKGKSDDWLEVDRVEVNSAVCIANQDGKERRWIIVEDSTDAKVARSEFRPSHPLVKELIGKKVDDTVTLPQWLLENEVVIEDIKSKYVHAFQETMNAFQMDFPGTPGIWRIPIRLSQEPEEINKNLQPIFSMVDQRLSLVNQVEQFYLQGHLPIGALSTLLGKNPVEIQAALTANRDVGVLCSIGSLDEREGALSLLESDNDLVVDLIALLTLQQLGIGDDVLKAFGGLGVARTTLETIDLLLHDPLVYSQGYWTIGKEGNQYTKRYVSREIIEHNKQFLEGLLAWTDTNCEILTSSPAIQIGRNKREKLEELIGPSFVETLLIASSEDRVLYSDDQSFRMLAAGEFEVAGVWTQALLMNMQKRGLLKDEQYNQAVVKLACLHYYNTSVNPQILLEATKQADWHPGYPFSPVVEVLAERHSSPITAIRVASDYVRLLWQQQIQPFQYEILVTAVLDVLVTGRKNRAFVLREFEREMIKRFPLAPTAVDQLRELMKTWNQIHVF